MGIALSVAGVALGSAIAMILYVFGTLASAQGQILKATLDTAVNTSPFLEAEDRTRIMSLPDPTARA